jgi:hypothetical protein
MPESADLNKAIKEFKKCGISEKAAYTYVTYGRTWEHFRNIINAVKRENPNIIFEVCLHPQYVPKITIDPETKECINTKSWAINFGKWNLINPETGNVFTLEESQEFMNRFTKGVKEELGYYWYADVTNEEFRKFLIKRANRYIEYGADAIGFDILYGQLNAIILILKWMKSHGYYNGNIYDHPAVKETTDAVYELVNEIKKQHVYVGGWGVILTYPEELKIPKFDYIYLTPSKEEVEKINFDKNKWEKAVQLAEKRFGNNILIMSFIDNGGLDSYPMHMFTQELSKEQQIESLEKWDNFTRSLGIIPVYPVQDGVMGKTVKRLSYGKYNKFDALAPEFRIYETIKELSIKVKS